MHLFFLSQNNIAYMNPVFDPWFSANGTYTVPDSKPKASRADFDVSVMGCAEQYRMCNPATGACTPFSGFLSLSD